MGETGIGTGRRSGGSQREKARGNQRSQKEEVRKDGQRKNGQREEI